MRRDKGAWTGSVVFIGLLTLLLVGPGRGRALFHNGHKPGTRPLVHRDLKRIMHDTLRVLVMRDPLSWEEYNDEATGLEWELLERFAHSLHLPLKAVPADHPDSLLLMLQRGDGDVIAAQFTPLSPRSRYVSVTRPYRLIAPVRAGVNVDAIVRTTAAGRWKPGTPDTLHISRWSPFADLEKFMDTLAALVVIVPDSLPEEDLLATVSLGRVHGMVLSDAWAMAAAKRFPQVSFAPRLGSSIPLAFAVRTNSEHLRIALDRWLADAHETEARQHIIASYGEARLSGKPVRTLGSITLAADSISPFDSLFQTHADNTSFDWQLLAAVAFKESRFDSNLVSKAGASGIMQIMPATAQALGMDSAATVEDHIRAAKNYLALLDTMWRGSVPQKDQRLKFVLASYNAGPGHIKDAQRLAEQYGLDTKRWDGSVERALLLLSRPRFFTMEGMKNGYCRGHETFWYVRDVVAAFAQFRKGTGKASQPSP